MKRTKDDRKVIVPAQKGSEMERFYLKEARDNGMGLPTLFYNLLEDRYLAMNGQRSNLWFPRSIPTVNDNNGHHQQDSEQEKADPKLAMSVFGGEDD